MPATVITYNGVTVSHVETQEITGEPLYDESGVVVRGVRRAITFRGRVHDVDSEVFIDSLEELVSKLNVPRKALSITMNGETFASVTAAGGGLTTSDASMGPLPRGMTVRRIAGGRFAEVVGTLEWFDPLDKDAASTPQIVSSRWEQRIGTNATGYGTRVISGHMRLSSRVASPNPDLFRCYVMPVETAGYLIRSAEFIVGSDGMTLTYQVVHEEAYRPFAKGILRAEATFEVTVLGGAAVTKTLSGRMEGAKTLPKSVLVDAVTDLIQNRFNFSRDTIKSWKFTEDVYGANSLGFAIESTGAFGNGNKPVWVSMFRRAHSAQASPLGLQGRFKQLDPYGNSFVYAAFQALFSSATDGNPANAAAFAKANVGRWSRADATDDDDDGHADRICAPAIIEAAELCDEVTDDLGIALTERPYNLADSQDTASPVVDSYQTVQRRVITQTGRITHADSDTPDTVIQYGKPHVEELHAGWIKRAGEPPEIPIPEALTAQTNRKATLIESRQIALPVEPFGDGGSLLYGAAYGYKLSMPYFPSDTVSWQSVSVRHVGESTSRTYLQYRAGNDVEPAQNAALALGAASNMPVAEGGYFV